MLRIRRWASVLVVALIAGPAGAAPEDKDEGWLKLVEKVTRDDLDRVVSVVVSPDGKFVYAASWQPATLTAFARDPASGRLTHKQTIADPNTLQGTTGLALSVDGKLAIATAFSSKTAVLLKRDASTGELAVADVARDGEKDVRLNFAVDAAFSTDGKFAFVLDDSGPSGSGAVITFRVADGGKLELVGTDEGKDGCYSGARGICVHPDGKTILIACYRAGTVVVADVDKTSGKTSVRHVVKDEEGDVHGLAGAMGVVLSPDGKFAYVSAGRFSGDNAVTAFRLGDDGKLAFLQEIVDGQGDFKGFEGGNHLTISPDGRDVYATATRSAAFACFRRDPATGKLSFVVTLPDGGEVGDNGAAGVAVSPDGTSVYLATEDAKTLTVFKRTPPK